MVTSPIWKDIEYVSSASVLNYSIDVDGETIFIGKAYRKPRASTLSININRICQNYLSNELNEGFVSVGNMEQYTNPNAARTFYLRDGNGNTLETYQLNYDWSYETVASPSPINGHYAYGQFILSTSYTVAGQYYTNTVRRNTTSGYCGDYAIYYLDSYGRWQSFLFEGKSRKYDTVTSYEYNRSFNNTTIQFERNRYVGEIETRYELGTGWLTDEQSANFAKNLVETNMAYLHNLNTGKIVPIVMNQGEIEYKKYINDRHMVEYQITVKESQSKIRL